LIPHFLHHSGHAVTVDTEREQVWQAVGEFIGRVASETSAAKG